MFQTWVIFTGFQIITSIQYKYFSTVVFLQLIFQLDILSLSFVGSSLCENVLFWDEFSLCFVVPEVIFLMESMNKIIP